MENLYVERTVGEVLADGRGSDAYVDYVCRAYGQLTIQQLLEKIERSKPVGCFNRHELENTSFTICPSNQVDAEDGVINNLCSHQMETDVQDTTDSAPLPHKHAAGLYRAGLYVVERLGGALPAGATHDAIMALAKQVKRVDDPCYLEFSRFTGHQLRKPLEDRDAERLPSLRSATTLPMLKQAVNAEKSACAAPMNAIRDAVAAAVRVLL